MNKLIALSILFLSMCIHSSADTEIRRIRIENTAGGLIQVSMEQGHNYRTVGRVRHPAEVRILGFAAATYTPSGTVAATAIHGIRIKVGQETNSIGKAGLPLLISIVPVEFQTIPKRYGGHRPRSSGIETDIHSGTSIFRNLAPYVGNAVYLEVNGNLNHIPEGYMPNDGDIFVIIVTIPDNPLASVEFENRDKGKVTATYSDGKQETIAHVVRPVKAVGRYDGTTYNGVGSINTNHGGVITISTAPKCSFDTVEGASPETRGGFMIQPIYHIKEQNENKPQVMAIAADDSTKPLLEGTPPLFNGNIPLTFYENNYQASCRVEVSIDNGNWEKLPKIVGRVDNAFSPDYLSKLLNRKIDQGITSIRLTVPKYDINISKLALETEVDVYNKYLIKKGVKPVSGTVAIQPKKAQNGQITIFYVNGNKVYSSNVYPFEYVWNTVSVPNGMHRLEIETPNGREIRRVLVMNTKSSSPKH